MKLSIDHPIIRPSEFGRVENPVLRTNWMTKYLAESEKTPPYMLKNAADTKPLVLDDVDTKSQISIEK